MRVRALLRLWPKQPAPPFRLLTARALHPRSPRMSMLMERVSKRSLDFRNQRRAYVLRTVHKLPYTDIVRKVVNLAGEHPVWGTVRNICKSFATTKAVRPYKYHRCGRTPWQLTPAVQKFILRRLLADRVHKVVTSTSLAEDIAREQGGRTNHTTWHP